MTLLINFITSVPFHGMPQRTKQAKRTKQSRHEFILVIKNVGMFYLNKLSSIITMQKVRRQPRRGAHTFCQLSEHCRQVLDRKKEGGRGGEEQGKQT